MAPGEHNPLPASYDLYCCSTALGPGWGLGPPGFESRGLSPGTYSSHGVREGWGSSALCRASRTQGAAADPHSFPAGCTAPRGDAQHQTGPHQGQRHEMPPHSSPCTQPCAVGPVPQAAPHDQSNSPRMQHSLPELLQSFRAARQD